MTGRRPAAWPPSPPASNRLAARCRRAAACHRTRRSPLIRFRLPLQRVQPRCARPGRPTSDYPVPAFSPGRLQSPVRTGRCALLRFLISAPSRRASHPGLLQLPGRLDVAPRVIRARFFVYFLRAPYQIPQSGFVAAWPASCRPLRHADPATLLGFDPFRLPFAALIRLQPFVAVSAGVDPFPGHGPTCR